MKKNSIIASVLFISLSFPSLGQVDKVFNSGEISESSLVDALMPASEPVQGTIRKTRSIRISPERDAPVAIAKRPSASMLVTFETNSAELTPRAKQMLDTLGKALQSDKLAVFKFSIEGHADPRGGEQFNLQLSQQRAEKVVSYLAEQQKIDQRRLVAIGKGQSQLLNTSNPDAPENRRVTVRTIVE